MMHQEINIRAFVARKQAKADVEVEVKVEAKVQRIVFCGECFATPPAWSSSFWFRVPGSGFRVSGSVHCSPFTVHCSGFLVHS